MIVTVVDGEGCPIRTTVGDQRSNDCLREPLLQEGTAAITEEEVEGEGLIQVEAAKTGEEVTLTEKEEEKKSRS